MSPVSRGTSRSTLALETGEAKLWILLVGVNQYQDQRLPSLRYSAQDCQGLGEALAEATQGFPQKEVRIHQDFAAPLPKKETVRASLKQIAAAAKPKDTVLFYFSGHGMLEQMTQQAVLCLADSHKDNLLETGLGLQEVLQLLGNCAARQQLVWLDACHSGGMTLLGARGNTPSKEPLLNPTPQMVEVLRQRAAQSKGFYALLSCDQAQQSWEFPELGHGVFTYYLMQGLRGEAADSQGVIEADGLYRYVYHQTLQYIDKTNQQLELINQQKRSRGETQLYPRYPLQTPKRIVEAVGELILGLRPTGVESLHPRQALVVEGLSGSKTSIALSILLRGAGGFELEYWPRPGKPADVREAIALLLQGQILPQAEPATVLLYLRGELSETEAGEPGLVVGQDIRLSRSWLRQQLRRSSIAQQIVILDCPASGREGLQVNRLLFAGFQPSNLPTFQHSTLLQDWVEDLQLTSEQGQCLIAAASPSEDPERFAQALLDTLVAANQQAGLAVAGWITKVQVSLAGSGIPLHIWLSGARGVIEVLPGNTGNRGLEPTEGFDLGLCPYMGLSAFGEEDAQYFYGREILTQQLINQLAHCSFLCVVGASGSGKSSIVQAGLIAQLRQGKQLPSSEQWWVKSFRPGARPLEALAWRLVDMGTEKEKAYQQMQLQGMLYQGVESFVYWVRSRPEPMVVLVVDQFEELFTLAPAQDRERFLELVLGAVEYAADRFKFIITLRADFIASCLEQEALAKALQQSSVLVPPRLTEDDYRRVIVNPAEQVGLKVEPALVMVLLQELNTRSGDLPLLEFVLEQLWSHRSKGELTLVAYQEQIGGLKGALERKAQTVYDSLDPDAQRCAQWIFLSLTQLGEGTEDTRRRVFKSDLVVAKYPAALVERTLQALTTAKLVVIDLEEGESAVGQSRGSAATPTVPEELGLERMKQEVTVEIAHEILIRHWSTLRWWLEENRARLQQERQISQAAHLWQQSGQQPDFLLQGVRLSEAEEIYIKYTDELSGDVQRFIEACLEKRQQQQLQAKRRFRQAQAAVAVISMLGLAALSLAGLVYGQKQVVQLREIEALNSSSEALLLSNQQLEALIASVNAGKQLRQMQGFGNFLAPSQATQIRTASTLSQAVYETQERDRLEGHSQQVNSVAFSPDNKLLASASDDKTVRLWSRDGRAGTGALPLQTLSGHSDRVTSVTFSPDGKILASASADKTIKLWRTDGTLIQTLTGHGDWVTKVSFSSDGQTLASASRDKTIKLWRIDGRAGTGALPLQTLNGHSGWVWDVSFSPDGQTLASASEDKTIKLWRIDGTSLNTLTGNGERVSRVTFSPDGQTLASASGSTLKLWSIAGKPLQTFNDNTKQVNSISFSPDGKTLASAGAEGTVKLWSLDGTLLKTFKGPGEQVIDVSFSPDGKTLATASADKTVRLWETDSTRKTQEGGVSSVSFSPDGKMFASGGLDNTVKIWRRDGGYTGSLFKTLGGHESTVAGVSFSPDGKILASASADKTIKIWSIANGTLLKTLTGHGDGVTSVSFSKGSKTIASASADKSIKIWSIADGTLLKTLTGHDDKVASVSFSPDGKILASGSYDNTVKLWTLDGTLLKTLTGHSLAIESVTFNFDGKTLATGSWDNTIKLWRVADGTEIHTLAGHSDGVTSVSFNSDGQLLVSGSADKTIKLWNVADGILLKTLVGHPGKVNSISFSPEGKALISAGEDAGVILWNLDLDNLLKRGCDRLHDYLKTHPNVNKSNPHLCDDF